MGRRLPIQRHLAVKWCHWKSLCQAEGPPKGQGSAVPSVIRTGWCRAEAWMPVPLPHVLICIGIHYVYIHVFCTYVHVHTHRVWGHDI